MAFAQETLGAHRTAGIRLEEVDSTDDSWLITLSMIGPRDPEGGLSISAAFAGKRQLKIFTARRDTGEIIAMKIREFQTQ
jgi:hypothetical protein